VGELLHNLRQLVDLDRSFGVEFTAKPPPGATAAKPPVRPEVPVPAPAPRPAAPPPVPAAPSVAARPALPIAAGLPAADLAAIAAKVAVCQACKLCPTRRSTVPGEGSPSPELVFVGEGPGAEEDASGRPFVGPAGQLLDRMITAMGLARGEVFIANVVKCRPPGNRNPDPDEIAACMPFLEAQLAILRPKVICTLGNVPLKALIGAEAPGITKAHGRPLSWRGITLLPTFHPSYLLRNPEAKKPAWEDLKQVLALLGRQAPPPRGAPASAGNA
jgi:DNA polymerase